MDLEITYWIKWIEIISKRTWKFWYGSKGSNNKFSQGQQ